MDTPWPDPQFRDLTPALISSLSADDIGDAILQHVEWQVRAKKGDRTAAIEALPVGTRAIYTTFLVDAEVNNGGFNQFFYNPSGELAGDALVGYELLGAEDYAEIMRAAIATRESERERMAPFYDAESLEAFSRSYEHTELGEVDQRYYSLGDRIYQIWFTFARERSDLLVR
jgi:hypothetical protein